MTRSDLVYYRHKVPTENTKDLLVYVGPNNPHMHIFEKILANGTKSITDQEDQELTVTYGHNYKHKLGLSFLNKYPSTTLEFLQENPPISRKKSKKIARKLKKDQSKASTKKVRPQSSPTETSDFVYYRHRVPAENTKDENAKDLLVYVGPNNPHMHIFEKILANKSITDQEDQELTVTYGHNYKHKLGLSFLKKDPSTKLEFVQEHLRDVTPAYIRNRVSKKREEGSKDIQVYVGPNNPHMKIFQKVMKKGVSSLSKTEHLVLKEGYGPNYMFKLGLNFLVKDPLARAEFLEKVPNVESICKNLKDGISFDVYKVYVHGIGHQDDRLYIFAGKQGCEDIFDKLQANGLASLNQEDHVRLAKAYGNHYKESLALNKKKKYKAKVMYVDSYIHPDDTLFIVKQKIGRVLNKDPSEIYTWIKSFVSTQDVAYWETLLELVFKDKPLQTSEYLNTLVFHLTGRNLDINGEDINKDEAIEIILKAGIQTVKVPLGLKYMRDSHYEFFPVDPSEHKKVYTKQELSNIVPSWELQQHIESFVVLNKTINVMCKPDDPTQVPNHNLYFIKLPIRYYESDKAKDKKVDESELIQHEKDFDELIACFKSDDSDSDFECSVNYIHLRNEVYEDIDIPTQAIFHTLNPDKHDIPFVKIITSDTSLVKIHKQYVREVPKEKLISWTKNDVNRRSNGVNNIILKLWLQSRRYASITIFKNGTVDLEIDYGTDSTNSTDIITIQRDLRHVNNKLNQIHPKIPLFDVLVFKVKDVETITKIVRMVISSNIAIKKEHSFNETQLKTIFERYPSIFNVGTVFKSVLSLVYKKTNGFGCDDHISQFAKRLNTKEGNLVARLTEVFGLQKHAAKHYASNWQSTFEHFGIRSKMGTNKYHTLSTRPQFFANIKLRPTIQGYRVVMENITSLIYVRRILKYITCIIAKAIEEMSYGKNAALAQKLKTDDVKPDKNPLKKKSVIEASFDDEDPVYGYDDTGDYMEFAQKQMKSLLQDDDDMSGLSADFYADDSGQSLAKLANEPYNKYILRELARKDKELFDFKKPNEHFKSYARSCQKTSYRQPVVISKEERDQLAQEDESAYNYHAIPYGSTEELEKQNFYICPQVWCPKSRKPMTLEQYQRNKEKCPDPNINEEPILFVNGWADKKNPGVIKKRNIGFLKKHEHPNNLCMPCCFVPDKLKQMDDNMKSCLKQETIDKKHKTKPYIMSYSHITEQYRYGLLPPLLSTFLGSTKCGHRDNGSGNAEADTYCFVRQGMPPRRQSFLYTMSQMLNNPDINSDVDVIQAIVKNLTIDTFMAMYNGRLIKRFIDVVDTNTIFSVKEWNKFTAWFVSEDAFIYVKRFHLTKIRKTLSNMKEFTDKVYAKQIRREFLIYSAFHKFLQYLQDMELVKSHQFLLELFNYNLQWLNQRAYNYILFEHVNDSITMSCMTNMYMRTHKPCILLYKTPSDKYEPIFNITAQPPHTYKFVKEEYSDLLSKIYRLLNSKCTSLFNPQHATNIYHALEKTKFGDVHQVINYDFHLIGFWLHQQNMYIPLKYLSHLLYEIEGKVIYVDEIFKNKETFELDPTDAKLILDEMNVYLSEEDRIYVKKTHNTHLDLAAPTAGNLNVIPLRHDGDTLPESIDLDMNMLVQLKTNDVRVEAINEMTSIEFYCRALWNEIIKLLNRQRGLKVFVEFCRHPSNPIPLAVRQQLLMTKINSYFTRVEKASNGKGTRIIKGLDSIVSTYIHKSLLHPDKFHNTECSSILRQKQCEGQCSWKDNIKKEIGQEFDRLDKLQGKKKERNFPQKCLLDVREDMYDVIRSQVMYNLINRNVPLTKVIVNEKYLKPVDQDIVILTEDDILQKDGSIHRLYEDTQSKDTWGFNVQDVDVPIHKVKPLKDFNLDANNLIIPDEENWKKVKHDLTSKKNVFKKGFEENVHKDCHVDKNAHPDQCYDNMWIYKLFSTAYNTRSSYDTKHYTAEELKTITRETILKNYQDSPKNERLAIKLAYNQQLVGLFYPKKTKLKENITFPTLLALKTALESPTYYPSDLEIEVLAEFTKINIIVISRRRTRVGDKIDGDNNVNAVPDPTAKTPDAIWCLGRHKNPLCIIFLRNDFVRKELPGKKKIEYDEYRLIVKNRVHYMFDDDDLTPIERKLFLSEKCGQFELKEDVLDEDEEPEDAADKDEDEKESKAKKAKGTKKGSDEKQTKTQKAKDNSAKNGDEKENAKVKKKSQKVKITVIPNA
jgi:hypothetical protein